MAASAAAAATAVLRQRNGSVGGDVNFELPKLQWVQVYDQQAPSHLYRVPVPRLFQHGQEQFGKLRMSLVTAWLSRAVDQQVTAIFTSPCSGANDRGQQVGLVPFDETVAKSPFDEGCIVVVCCNGDSLVPEILSKLPNKETIGEYAIRQLQRFVGGKDTEETKEAVCETAKHWGKARARVGVMVALARTLPQKSWQPEELAQSNSAYSSTTKSTDFSSQQEESTQPDVVSETLSVPKTRDMGVQVCLGAAVEEGATTEQRVPDLVFDAAWQTSGPHRMRGPKRKDAGVAGGERNAPAPAAEATVAAPPAAHRALSGWSMFAGCGAPNSASTQGRGSCCRRPGLADEDGEGGGLINLEV